MKILFNYLLVLSIFLFFGSTPLYAQQKVTPFGLHKGMTLEQVIEATGEQPYKVIESNYTENSRTYYFSNTPTLHTFFSDYHLSIHNVYGLTSITACSPRTSNNNYYIQLETQHNAIHSALVKKYGVPGDIQNAGENATEGEDKSLLSLWFLTNETNLDDLIITLSYRFISGESSMELYYIF